MKRSSCLLLLVLVAACGSPKTARLQLDTPVVVTLPATTPPPPVATAAPTISASPPEEPLAEPVPDCSDAAFAAAAKELEVAMPNGDSDEIVAKFEKALFIRTRDVGLRNRYMKFLVDQGLGGALQAEILVAIGDENNAGAWTLLGVDAENENKNEVARAYFARAAAIDPKSDGAVRLGKRSRCAGAFAEGTTDSSPLDIVKGWLGLFTVIDGQRMVREEEKPDPTTEAEARERVCINNDLNEITDHDVCQGKGPWTVQTGHMHFHDHMVIIIPLSNNRYATIPYFTGFGCRGGSDVNAAILGDIIEVQTRSLVSVVEQASPCDEGPHDAMTEPCINDTIFKSDYYSASTGKLLASITEGSSREKHVIKDGKLTRTQGSFCKETINLRAIGGKLK